MNLCLPLSRSLAVCGFALLLTGCLLPKPTADPTRFFVLSTLQTPASVSAAQSNSLSAIEIRSVTLPAYLRPSSLAIQRAPQEIHYAEWDRWAERLDRGFQRVLVRDLAILLPSRNVRVSRASFEPGSRQLDIIVDRFEVDDSGSASLAARWRLVSLAGAKLVTSGEADFKRQGPNPVTDPRGAVSVLSDLVADFARDLARRFTQMDPAT